MGDTYPRFTVAAVQAASVFFDRDKSIDKAVRLIEEAADKGAVIIGFPEYFIPGSHNIWYCGKKSNPLPRQGLMFKEYVKNSVKVPSPATDRLCQAAKKAHAFVVMGMSELDDFYPGTLYLSQLFISDTGEIMGVHRKLLSTWLEKLIFTHGDGSYFNVYDTPYGKISAMNCGEHAHSLFKYALLAMGTQIHVAAWPSFPDPIHDQSQRDSVDFRVRQFAHEGKIFVINTCAIVDRQNVEYSCDTQEEKDAFKENTGGGSSIIGPNGEYRAGPMLEGEGVLTAEISLEDVLPGKQMHNVLGHYTRWDIFSLNFNRERLTPFRNEPPPQNNITHLASQLQDTRDQVSKIGDKLERVLEKLEMQEVVKERHK